MAAGTALQVTSGSGPYLALGSTYTESGKLVADQKVILGEPYLPTYTAGMAAAPSTATVNSHLFQLMAGASLNVRIRRILVYQYAVATTASLMPLALMRLTTAGTGGTVMAGQPLNPTDPTAGAVAMALPTAKGTEGGQVDTAVMYMMQTVAASAPLPEPAITWRYDFLVGGTLIIPAGTANGIAVKNQTAVAGGNVVVVCYFTETPF